MGLLISKNNEEKIIRKINVDLLSKEVIQQNYCSNLIKTTRYTM